MSRVALIARCVWMPVMLTILTAGCNGERGEQPTAEFAAEERVGGLAAVCSQAAPESLNPFVSPDLGAGDMRLMLFTPLVLYGEDGAFRPYLATDWRWEDDGRRLILAIRGDVAWHDGTPLTTHDVAWTLMYEESVEADANEPIPEPMEPRYAFLTRALGLEPVHLRRVCMAINSLPKDERLAFHNMLVQRKGFGRYAQESGMAPSEARDLLLSATRKIQDSLKRRGGNDA